MRDEFVHGPQRAPVLPDFCAAASVRSRMQRHRDQDLPLLLVLLAGSCCPASSCSQHCSRLLQPRLGKALLLSFHLFISALLPFSENEKKDRPRRVRMCLCMYVYCAGASGRVPRGAADIFEHAFNVFCQRCCCIRAAMTYSAPSRILFAISRTFFAACRAASFALSNRRSNDEIAAMQCATIHGVLTQR